MDGNVTTDFDLISELSIQGRYDYVVVGSGFGGGILAQKLAEGKKRVLLIEKGGLTFSTHCLNTSRPHWQIGSVQGPSQDNDVVYNAIKQKVQTAAGSDPYVGGPVYCLGGRSTVWGLFAPEVGKTAYQKYFPKRISDYLGKDGYKNAFNLLTNGSQTDGLYPTSADISANDVTNIKRELKAAIEAFYEDYSVESIPVVSLAPIAAEFKSPKPYQFPQGAYSTVDALLEKAYARDQYLTILMNAEVLSVSVNKANNDNYQANSLTVRAMSGQRKGQIYAKKGIILCAGTIGTATIALNSGLQDIHSLVGKGLTDHEIWGVRFGRENKIPLKEPLKLQSEITVCGVPALLNVVVNANTFFGRGSSVFNPPTQYFDHRGKLLKGFPDKLFQEKAADGASTDYDTVNLTLEYAAELFDTSEVLNVPSPDPVIRASRQVLRQDENSQEEMQKLATLIRNKILDITEDDEPAPRFSLAGFGVVAHEVGTMRLQIPNSRKGYVVNDKYQIRKFSNLYVCDLSVFPVSPPANPSLTLAALALQLADDLLT
jgi:choline dehydrogenase-like flavoprotein